MKCVELAKTSPPSAVKDGLRNIPEISAQCAFETVSKEDGCRRLALFSRVQTSGIMSAECAFERILKGDGFTGFTQSSKSQTTGERVATLGSDGMVYCHKDDGIFSAVLAAYNNHWKLRTSPDDWWFCVVKKVSVAIDEHAEKPAVRNLFVNHEGKKTLSVSVPTTCIYDIDCR